MDYNLYVASVFLPVTNNFIFCLLLPALLLGLSEHIYLQGYGSVPTLTLLFLFGFPILLTFCLANSYLSLGLSFVALLSTLSKPFPGYLTVGGDFFSLFGIWTWCTMYGSNLGLRTLNCSFVFFLILDCKPSEKEHCISSTPGPSIVSGIQRALQRCLWINITQIRLKYVCFPLYESVNRIFFCISFSAPTSQCGSENY